MWHSPSTGHMPSPQSLLVPQSPVALLGLQMKLEKHNSRPPTTREGGEGVRGRCSSQPLVFTPRQSERWAHHVWMHLKQSPPHVGLGPPSMRPCLSATTSGAAPCQHDHDHDHHHPKLDESGGGGGSEEERLRGQSTGQCVVWACIGSADTTRKEDTRSS